MSWLVDAHAHYHQVFGWKAFLAGAIENLDRASREHPELGPFRAACLLFADPEGVRSVEDLAARGSGGLPPGWELEAVEGGAIVVAPPGGEALVLLVPGRQVRTRGRLELLALACDEEIPDGITLEEAAERGRKAGAVCVVPWGFGKWWFGRGRTVARLLENGHGAGLHLGDNGNRPALAPDPRLFGRARRWGMMILPGSDPLPFPDHAGRAASAGFVLSGETDPRRPGASVRAGLAALDRDPPFVGVRQGSLAFVADQVRMQLRRSHQ